MIPDFVAALKAFQVVELDQEATGACLSLTLEPAGVLEAATAFDRAGYLLEDVMASDLAEGFEVQYHFSLLSGPTRIVARLTVPHDAPDVPSIAGIFPGADWHERECFDFYGIRFTGHPNLHRLLLPEDFEGHPLVKGTKARKPLADLMPQAWLVACGLARPEEPAPEKPAQAPKDA